MPAQSVVVPKPGREAAPSITPVDKLLPRLDRLRQTGAGCWWASCPAHDDRHPSLSIRETEDGALLIHCFTGCSVADIVAAVDLQLADLFPPTDRHQGPRKRRPWNPLDMLRCLVHEARVVAIAAGDLARGESLNEEDTKRLALAAERLSAALRLVEGAR